MFAVINKSCFIPTQEDLAKVESVHRSKEAAAKSAANLLMAVKKCSRTSYLRLSLVEVVGRVRVGDLIHPSEHRQMEEVE